MYVIIDIGTHKCQEFKAIFHTNPLSLFLRVISHKLLGIETPKISETISMIKSQNSLKKLRSKFFVILTEPNVNVLDNKYYKFADLVYCVALGQTSNKIEMSKLFFHSKDIQEQGSSIYESKRGKEASSFIPATLIDPNYFMQIIKDDLDNRFGKNGYQVMLRLNCEGAENEVIRATENIFHEKLRLVMGSLDDVMKYHGEDTLKELEDFLQLNNIKFSQFNTLLTCHNKALSLILKSFNNEL